MAFLMFLTVKEPMRKEIQFGNHASNRSSQTEGKPLVEKPEDEELTKSSDNDVGKL